MTTADTSPPSSSASASASASASEDDDGMSDGANGSVDEEGVVVVVLDVVLHEIDLDAGGRTPERSLTGWRLAGVVTVVSKYEPTT